MKIGIDWGGTKIEAIALDNETNEEINRIRVDAPKDNYQDIISTVYDLIKTIASDTKQYFWFLSNHYRRWNNKYSRK